MAKREMFLFVQSVVDKIVVRYGYEKLGEFTFLLSQYAKYWDEHGSGDGFDFSHYSEATLIYFDTIQEAIDERHRQFVVQGEQMTKLAKERWEKEQQKEKRREQKRQWYVDNKERVNQKRRKKVPSKLNDNNSKMSSGVSSDKHQSIGTQGIAENDAARIMNNEIMNNKNIIKNYDIRARDAVDNLGTEPSLSDHKPSGSLTGHNLAEGSVIKGNHKKKEHKKHKKRRTKNRKPQNFINHNPLSPAGQLPQNGGAELGNEEVQPPPLRPTIYGNTWIRIGDDFEVNLFDPEFETVARMRRYTINGFEMWVRKKFSGERKDKWWLRRLLGQFAVRQGKISYMADKPEGEK